MLHSMQRLTVSVVDQFIADLKDCVQEAKAKPSEDGHMVTVYGMRAIPCIVTPSLTPSLGLGTSSAVGPQFLSRAASMFLDTLYAA